MRHRHHISIIIVVVALQIANAFECENGIISDSLMIKAFSEDECLSQSNSSHCYKAISNSSGLCYLAREEKISHKGEDCTYHLPIVYESGNITIPQAFLNKTFEPVKMNGTFPESALKHCQRISCYLIIYEKNSDYVYFMDEPAELSLNESNITFGSNDKHYTMYFEPRCQPTKPQNLTNVDVRNADRTYATRHEIILSTRIVKFKRSDIISSSESPDDCWKQCVGDDNCVTAYIFEELCYLIGENPGTWPRHSDDGIYPYFMARDKRSGDEHICDFGIIKPYMLAFRDSQSVCEDGRGMCYKDIGTPEMPNPLCYSPSRNQLIDDRVDVGNGWQTKQLVKGTGFEADLPIKEPASDDSECHRKCFERSCIVLSFDSNRSPSETCRLGVEPLRISEHSSTSGEEIDILFVKFVFKFDELCQHIVDPLPPKWQLGGAYYDSFREVDADSIDECIGKCDPNGDCNGVLIYDQKASSCLIFESNTIFIPNSEAGSDSVEQCIVVPANEGKFRPKEVRHFSSFYELASVEPRERIVFPMKVDVMANKNVCWDYCSKLYWCRAVHIVPDFECFLYDTEEDTIRNKNDNEQAKEFFVMMGKHYTDANSCDQGGLINDIFFQHSGYENPYCQFFQLCHRDSMAGEKRKPICYLGRETEPEPLKGTVNCEVQPFFTSNPGYSEYCDALNPWYEHRPEGDASYEACAQVCVLDENCYGLAYYSSKQECHTMANDASWLDIINAREAIQTRDDDYGELVCQIAFEVPHCEPCVQRVQMEQQIKYEDELQCTHTSLESCSDVYKTIFKTQEVEECKESFVKNCHIEYEKVPTSEKVEICHSPLTRDCNEEGPEICSTEYETVCATTYHENEVTDDVVNCNTVKEEVCDSDNENCRMVPRQVCEVEQVTGKKLTPETDCHQESREVCGPEVCPIVPGERICADEIKTFVREVPQEKCEISPKTVCNMIHKIVPKLEMNQECIEVPQEICQRVQVEAKKEWVPVIKYFCPPKVDSSDETDMNDDASTQIPDSSRSAVEKNMSPMAIQNSSSIEHFPFSARGSRRSSKSGR